jgi:hypothetical protein
MSSVSSEMPVSLPARGQARTGRADRDRRVGAGRRHLDPAVAVAERLVGALLQAQRLGVELELEILVGDRDDDVRQLLDASAQGTPPGSEGRLLYQSQSQVSNVFKTWGSSI